MQEDVKEYLVGHGDSGPLLLKIYKEDDDWCWELFESIDLGFLDVDENGSSSQQSEVILNFVNRKRQELRKLIFLKSILTKYSERV